MRLSTLKRKRILRKRFKARQSERELFYTGNRARGTPQKTLNLLIDHFRRNGFPGLFYQLRMRDDFIIEIYIVKGMKKATRRMINSVPWSESYLYSDSIIKDIKDYEPSDAERDT